MIYAWPADLPLPERQTWQAQPQDGRLKRRRETGPSGYRRRFSSVARQVSMSIDVGRDEKAIFDNFHRETTSGGSVPFTMADPTTDGWPLLDASGTPLLTADGEPLLLAAQWLCLFGDQMPTEAVRGIRFKIAFSVVVMP